MVPNPLKSRNVFLALRPQGCGYGYCGYVAAVEPAPAVSARRDVTATLGAFAWQIGLFCVRRTPEMRWELRGLWEMPASAYAEACGGISWTADSGGYGRP